MNAADYHDLCFGIRCAFCSSRLRAVVYDADGVEREWRPCECAATTAVGAIGMRYENGELCLARMETSRIEHPLAKVAHEMPYLDVGQSPPWPPEGA